MGYDGINKCTPPRKSGETPSVSTRFILGVENEQADAGRDCRTRLTRQNSQARTGTVHFPSSADHEKNWQPYPVDPYSATCGNHPYTKT